MRYGSVCSGIEAATVAWHPLGWRPSFFSEIDAFPRAVLEHHYPDVPLHGDFTTIKDGEYEPIELLVGGTPCQSFSVAGLRKGLDDDRGNLALEYLRLADRLRPRWLVWENVPGVLSSGGGRDFGALLGALGELGYGFAYRVLDAQYFGLAQRRKRVFLVGHLGDWRRAAAVLFEPESLRGNPPPRREAREIAPTIPARSTGGGGLGTDFECDGGLQLVTHTLRAEGFDASEDGTGRGTLLVPHIAGCLNSASGHAVPGNSLQDADQGYLLPVMSSGQANAEISYGITPTINCNRDGAPIAFHSRQDPHVSGAISHPIGANDNGLAIATPMAVRRLTPRECERLQGFPDDYTKIPWRAGYWSAKYHATDVRAAVAETCPDGPRYKALGNSMAVPVMAWIGRRIQIVENTLDEISENLTIEIVVGMN